jgi:DNA-binding transcriptional MerR regulator
MLLSFKPLTRDIDPCLSYDTYGRMTDIALQPGPEIPDKLYFKIGEVSELLGVEPYVLRYWETEFPVLQPKKSGTGHRLYRRKDVELLLRIKHLLKEKRYTIEGARQTLQSETRMPKASRAQKPRVQAELFGSDPLPEIRRELEGILQLLK